MGSSPQMQTNEVRNFIVHPVCGMGDALYAQENICIAPSLRVKSGDTLLVLLLHWPEDRVRPRELSAAPSSVVPDK